MITTVDCILYEHSDKQASYISPHLLTYQRLRTAKFIMFIYNATVNYKKVTSNFSNLSFLLIYYKVDIKIL